MNMAGNFALEGGPFKEGQGYMRAYEDEDLENKLNQSEGYLQYLNEANGQNNANQS